MNHQDTKTPRHQDTKTPRTLRDHKGFIREGDVELGHPDKNVHYEKVGEDVDKLAHAVIGVALEVHKLLGPGLLESVYEEALCVELRLRDIPFARQVGVAVNYKGQSIGEGKLDILVGNALVVELKAVDTLLPVHSAQLLTYLKVTGHRLGLLINFNASALKYGIKRMVL